MVMLLDLNNRKQIKEAKFKILDTLSPEQIELFVIKSFEELQEKIEKRFESGDKNPTDLIDEHLEVMKYLMGKNFVRYLIGKSEYYRKSNMDCLNELMEKDITIQNITIFFLMESCVLYYGLLSIFYSNLMDNLELYFINHAVRINIFESESGEHDELLDNFYLRIPQQKMFYQMMNDKIEEEYEEIQDFMKDTKKCLAELSDLNGKVECDEELHDMSVKIHDDIGKELKNISDGLNAIADDGFLKVKQELFEFHKQDIKKKFNMDLCFDEWNQNQAKYDMESFEVVYPADYFDELDDYLEKIKIS